jgi:hypothetical protein
MWNKPSTGQLAPKLGYAIALPRWNWMLGTGIYLDDVQATMTQIDQQSRQRRPTTMWWIAGIALLSVALIGACGLVLNVSESRIADCQAAPAGAPGRAVAGRRARPPVARAARQHQPDAGVDQAADGVGSSRARHAAAARLHKALDRLKAALGEVRNISHRLRPAELDVLGLPAALEHLGDEFGEHSGMRSACACAASRRAARRDQDRAVPVTQEALTNIEKHAARAASRWLAFSERPAAARDRRRPRLRRRARCSTTRARHRPAQHARAARLHRRHAAMHRARPHAAGGQTCRLAFAAPFALEGGRMTHALLIVDDHPLVREGLKARLSHAAVDRGRRRGRRRRRSLAQVADAAPTSC